MERCMKRPIRTRRLGVVLGSLMASSLAVGMLTLVGASGTASASTSSGLIEICKTWTAPPAGWTTTPTFQYSINDDVDPVTYITVGGAGIETCTAPIPVAAGTAAVTETQASWFTTTAISGLAGESYVDPSSVDLSHGTVNVNVPSDGSVAVVQFTNAAQTGYIEVCKATTVGDPSTGTYNFSITGPKDFAGVSVF